MRPSSFVLVPLLAAVAASAPAPNPGTSIQAAQDSAAATMKTLEAAGCNYLKCISALAGETAACGAAAAELGANILADLACFASVSGNIAGDVCGGCL